MNTFFHQIAQSSPLPINVSATILSDIQQCGRYGACAHLGGYSPIAPDASRAFGTAIHAGLDAWYQRTPGAPGRLEAALSAIESSWPKDATGAPIVFEGDHRSLGHALTLMQLYVNWWADTDQSWHVLHTEHTLHHKFSSTLPEYWGTIDLVVHQDGDLDGGVWIVDHKTTSEMGEIYDRKWKPDFQLLGYIVLAEACGLVTEPIAGCIVNGIKLSKSAATRPLVVKTGFSKPKDGANVEFRRVPVSFSATDRLEWLAELAERCVRLKELHQGRVSFSTTACKSFGKCKFHDLCTVPDELRQNRLETLYRLDRYDCTRGEKV